MSRVLNTLTKETWLMLPTHLEVLTQIASREYDIQALSAKVGSSLEKTRTVEMRGSIATIPVIGGIYRYANLFTEFCGATSTEILAQDIQTALNNPNVSHIVFTFDSPGGQASGIAELASMIKEGSQKKPMIAYVDDMAASAAYWLASACDHIAASKTAMVGSIGAVYTLRLNQGEGQTIEIVSSVSPKKRPNIQTEEGKAQIQNWADKFGAIFVEDVARYRGVSVEHVLNHFGQGDMLIGDDALNAGMIDEITTYEALIKQLS